MQIQLNTNVMNTRQAGLVLMAFTSLMAAAQACDCILLLAPGWGVVCAGPGSPLMPVASSGFVCMVVCASMYPCKLHCIVWFVHLRVTVHACACVCLCVGMGGAGVCVHVCAVAPVCVDPARSTAVHGICRGRFLSPQLCRPGCPFLWCVLVTRTAQRSLVLLTDMGLSEVLFVSVHLQLKRQ